MKLSNWRVGNLLLSIFLHLLKIFWEGKNLTKMIRWKESYINMYL